MVEMNEKALPDPDDGLVERLKARAIYELRNASYGGEFSDSDRFTGDLFNEAAAALQSKDDRIERLTGLVSLSEKERYRSCGELLTRAEAAEKQVQKLTAENERLREALRFYRDRWAYTPNKRYGGLEWRPSETLLDDCGNIARSALETQEGGK